ncbi:MAG: YgjV family protein [Clostridia bacterium]|nr:YgjV family protein [Clostridia bacterium]
MIIFSVLAFITLFISICIKDRNESLKVQSINCMFESLYAFSINAYTGAVLGVINFIRSSLFIKKEKFSKQFYLSLLVIFESIVITNCIFTWNGIISLLPTTGSIVRTYCLWQSNMKYVRMSGIVSGILFGMYYIYYQSWFMVAGYLLLFIISLYNVCKMDLKQPIQNLQKV